MRAITLHQPWATAVAIGLKSIETRHWATHIRGPIAIHAAKRASRDVRDQFDYFVRDRGIGVAFAAAGYTDFEDLPLGAIVATCEIFACTPVEEARRNGFVTPAEAVWGNYTAGRFAWILGSVRRLAEPISAGGKQGFFNWEDASARNAPGIFQRKNRCSPANAAFRSP